MIDQMPRRSNLSGTKLPDGRYQIRVTLTRLDGAKVRKPVYGKTLGEAQQKAHALIYESGRSLQESYTVAEAAEAWRAAWRIKPATTGIRILLERHREGIGLRPRF